jgi:hypothetical protein
VTARRLGVAGLTAAALALAGCTGSTEEPTPSPSTSVPAPSPSSPQPSAPVSTVPVRFGSKWDWNKVATSESWIRSQAPGVTFFEFQWCDVSPTGGPADWAQLDRVVERSRDLGVEMMLKIRTGTCAVTGGTAKFTRGAKNKSESRLPKDLTAYAAFVTSVVQRYAPRGVHTYAVENEVNGETFWSGTGAEFEQLFAVAAKAIKAADPSARISDGGISSTAYGAAIATRLLAQGKESEAIAAWNTYYERRIGVRGRQIVRVSNRAELDAMLAGDQARRNLAMLAADERILNSGLADIRQVHFYEAPEAAGLLMDYLKATTPAGIELQAWEVGSFVKGRDPSEAEMASDVVRTSAALIGGGSTMVIWLPLAFNPGGDNSDEPRSGLLDGSGAPRAGAKAFSAMRAAAVDATVSAVNADGVLGVSFTRAGTTTAYVWKVGSVLTVPSDVTLTPLTTTAGSPAAGEPVELSGVAADLSSILEQ